MKNLMAYHFYEAMPEHKDVKKLLPSVEFKIPGYEPLYLFMQIRQKTRPKRVSKPDLKLLDEVHDQALKFQKFLIKHERVRWMTETDR